MSRISNFVIEKTTDTHRDALNMSLLTPSGEHLVTVSINEITRELTAIFSDSPQLLEVDYEALIAVLHRFKVDLNDWADRVKDPEEG